MAQRAVLTEETVDIPCGLVLRSIGYRSLQIDPDIPFDEKQGVIRNDKGRVQNINGKSHIFITVTCLHFSLIFTEAGIVNKHIYVKSQIKVIKYLTCCHLLQFIV